MNTTRRAILGASALIPAAALLGCGMISSTTTNGVTTVTVNTADANNWGQAFINAASLIATLAIPASAPAILAIGATAKVDLAAFNTATNGTLTLTFNSGSPPAALASLLTDGQNLLTAAQGAIPAAAATQAQTYLTALATIVSTAEAAVGVSVAGAAARMTQTQALATLGVR